jgi:nucleoside phosphorylase
VTTNPDVLVIAATPQELASADGWRMLCCGVGPVEAAAATAAALAQQRPAAVLHVGIAGARRGMGLLPPTLVIGTSARYDDLSVAGALAPRECAPDRALVAAAQRAFPQAALHAIATSAAVGGTRDADVEAMEGFAVLRAAALAGVPALEVRAISNAIGESDRTQWRFAEAFAAITAATPALVRAVRAAVR